MDEERLQKVKSLQKAIYSSELKPCPHNREA